MTVLEKINAHTRDANIVFDEGPHTYTLKGSPITFTSVTTLIHHQFEQFNAEKILDIARRRHNSGLSTNLEILNVKSQCNQIEFQIPSA